MGCKDARYGSVLSRQPEKVPKRAAFVAVNAADYDEGLYRRSPFLGGQRHALACGAQSAPWKSERKSRGENLFSPRLSVRFSFTQELAWRRIPKSRKLFGFAPIFHRGCGSRGIIPLAQGHGGRGGPHRLSVAESWSSNVPPAPYTAPSLRLPTTRMRSSPRQVDSVSSASSRPISVPVQYEATARSCAIYSSSSSWLAKRILLK